MADVTIVDYGMANLRSVQKAFERVGATAEITADPARIRDCPKLILPGVGAFQDAISWLHKSGLAEPIVRHIENGRPFLGICLGMQLLFSRSHEDGVFSGLNIFAGDVVRFSPTPGLKVPHMGWNQLHYTTSCPLFAGLAEDSSVYFVHSYYPVPTDASLTSAQADYPDPFTAAIWKDNVFATQFHPEKSQQVGLTMLKNFVAIS